MKLGEEKYFREALEKATKLPLRDIGELFTKADFMEKIDKNMACQCWREFLTAAERLNIKNVEVAYAKKRIAELGKHTQ